MSPSWAAGYTGLWTAYYLLKRDPSLKVAVLEKEIAGFGASGRNGGWCATGFPARAAAAGGSCTAGEAALRRRTGRMDDTVDEIGRVAAATKASTIDFTRGGYAAHRPRPAPARGAGDARCTSTRSSGSASTSQLLDAQQTAERIKVAGALGGALRRRQRQDPPGQAGARPGAGGRAARRDDLRADRSHRLHDRRLPGAAHRARPRAGEDDRAGRRGVPVALAEAAPAASCRSTRSSRSPSRSRRADWQEIGWEARERARPRPPTPSTTSSKTADGRILFGGRGAPYHFGSSIKDEYDRHGPTHADAAGQRARVVPDAQGRALHPHLGRPARLAARLHADHRPTTRARNWRPPAATPASASATSNLAGRIAGRPDHRDATATSATCRVVNHRSRNWEPEPLRFLGVRYVQRGFMKLDEKAEATGVAPSGKSLAERLTRH